MSSSTTDRDWEAFGRDDAYWAVLTQDRFRKQVLDEESRKEFFLSGDEYIEWVFNVIRKHFDGQFNPGAGLDFGCGVGRLLLPIARRCKTAVGIDVSESMLKEAQRNCEVEKVANVSLVKGDDTCSRLKHGFDFINSFIVFQHIPCDRGLVLFRRMVELLNHGGVGAVHFTYSRANFQVGGEASQYWPYKQEDGGKAHLAGLKRAVVERLTKRKGAGKAAKGAKGAGPTMQMNPYLLNPVFQILQEAKVREMFLTFTDHSDTLGAVLFFKKSSGSYPFAALNE